MLEQKLFGIVSLSIPHKSFRSQQTIVIIYEVSPTVHSGEFLFTITNVLKSIHTLYLGGELGK